jgi:hypothetical protein
VVVSLIGGAAAGIDWLRARQRLGEPGLKVIAQPLCDAEGKLASSSSVYLPAQILDYQSTNHPIDSTVVAYLPKDTVYGDRLYSAADGFWVKVQVVLMGSDRSSIHKPQICLAGGGWQIDAQAKALVPVERPHRYELPVMKLTVRREVSLPESRKQMLSGLYVYWFVADGRLTNDHFERMRSMALELITTGVLQRWAYVSYFATCQPGEEESTFERMKQLIAASVPEFQLTSGAEAGREAAGK